MDSPNIMGNGHHPSTIYVSSKIGLNYHVSLGYDNSLEEVRLCGIIFNPHFLMKQEASFNTWPPMFFLLIL